MSPLTPPTGKRAVVIANGPSVDDMPPAFWSGCRRKGVLLIGTNRALAFEALQGVPLDALVIRDTYRDLWSDNKWGVEYHERLWKPCPAWKVGPAEMRVTHCDEFVLQVPRPDEWQFERVVDHNREAAVMRNASVVIMAANWAWIQGVRDIQLVGVDYYGKHAAMIAPWGSKQSAGSGQYDKPIPGVIEKQFFVMVKAIESRGGSIVNLSKDTKLKAVPIKEHRT